MIERLVVLWILAADTDRMECADPYRRRGTRVFRAALIL